MYKKNLKKRVASSRKAEKASPYSTHYEFFRKLLNQAGRDNNFDLPSFVKQGFNGF